MSVLAISVPREKVFEALWEKLQGLQGIVTFSRRLRHWEDVSKDEQPALFLAAAGQTGVQVRNLPPVWTLKATLHLYVHGAADPSVSPSTRLNELLDAIEAAIAVPEGEPAQTLGGLVQHAWIAGEIETDEGVLGDQAVAIIPIDILVP